jgi:hypothetical protein
MIGSINNNSNRPWQKEIFEINEQKIRLGLTRGNVGNASMLQLYYLLGMNTEIVFNYQICYQNHNKTRPWELFISLVANRDYDELMAKSAANLNYSSASNQISSTTKIIDQINNIEENQNQQKPEDEQQPSTSSSSAALAKNAVTGNSRYDIMEAEKMRFIQQLREQTTRKPPRRQIKLVHDGQKVCLNRDLLISMNLQMKFYIFNQIIEKKRYFQKWLFMSNSGAVLFNVALT